VSASKEAFQMIIEVLSGFIGTIAAVGAAGVGYVQSRSFVAKKLRFVDSASNPVVPVAAGVGAAVVAAPVVFFLPFIGAGTAVVFGIAVALGTRAGVKTFSRSLYP
jgi:hypothetical protein